MWQDRLLHCVVFTKTSEEFAPHYLAEIRHDMRQTTVDNAFSIGDWQSVSTRGGEASQRYKPAKKKNMRVVVGIGDRHAWRSCGTDSPSKRDHRDPRVGVGMTREDSKQHQRRCLRVIRRDIWYPFLQAIRRLLTRRESIYGRERQQS